MAKLKGLRPSRIIIKHALPNAWSPIIQLAVLNLAYMIVGIVGIVAIEVVFVYPGLGALIVDAVLNRDVPVIQGTAMVIRIIYAMPVFRITRAVAMDIEVMDYVEVARVRGEGLW